MFGKEIWASLLLLSLLAMSTAEDRIYNGTRVPPDDLLNVVKFWIYDRDYQKTGWCTGTIISKRHVLTAAHCLGKDTHFVEITTRVKNQQSFSGHRWAIHSGYPGNFADHDIAIITIHNMEFKIPPALLAAKYTQKEGDWLRVAGYGNTKYENKNGTLNYAEPAETLMQTYIRGYSKETCDNLTADYPNVKEICMYDPNTGTLPGDSGGPTFAQGKDGRYYQVGISSFGIYNKSGKLIVVTDVSYYCPWIEETTGGEVKCQAFDPTPIVPPKKID